jgi:hypothetical protein
MLLAGLSEHHPEDLSALYEPLLEALVASAARLDTEASRLDTGHLQTAELHVPAEHVKVADPNPPQRHVDDRPGTHPVAGAFRAPSGDG